jgi:hypothetical protein
MAIRISTRWNCNSLPPMGRRPIPSGSRPACASSPTAKKAARCGSFINGRRFVARGGNWGFSEDLLRYRAREYDAALRYHRDMNFTMIRNWVGQTGDDAFYEACDRYGIVVWQEFWLANPWDGPDPDDPAMFLRNVRDTVLRIRNHPSIGLYCGRNEGYPPAVLDDGIRHALGELAPGSHYISDSADGVVGGGGPYWSDAAEILFHHLAKRSCTAKWACPTSLPSRACAP